MCAETREGVVHKRRVRAEGHGWQVREQIGMPCAYGISPVLRHPPRPLDRPGV